eukprot:TRINITY_DN9193_c0_g1_i4.p1 TRINITY_DN9193_c0_g1~~TRINITY_DN9193_c0_g1_i4.p1  ORF type:complete len:158 (-),score=60.75 TRINITY_DN9193_c0_g1_i4:228-701(-)
MIGLNNAGKTTILYKLSLGEVVVTQPTVGSNVEHVKHKNVDFQVWDLAGQESHRVYWTTYYANTHAVVMVVDSSEPARLDTTKHELYNLLALEDLQGAKILVFANKQDAEGAMSAAEISDRLELHSIKTHEWHIQGCCALTGDGLFEGLEWVVSKLK